MKIFKAAVFLILCAAPLSAQQTAAPAPQPPATPPPSQASVKGTPPQPKIAQPFSITYNITLPSGVTAKEIVYDEQSINAKDFTILTGRSAQVGNSAEYTFRAVPFALGKTKFTAAWKLPDGSVIKADEAELDIARVNDGIRSADIVDIRMPITPFNFWRLILILIIIGLVSAAVVWWRKQAQSAAPAGYYGPPPPDDRPADIAARDRLAKLLMSGLWDRKEYKLFYVELAEIFRSYLYARFGIDTDPQTTSELLRAVKKSDAKSIYDQARQFLTSADLVKFAEVVPLTVDRDEDVKLLNAMIDATAVKVKIMAVGEGKDGDTA